MNSSSSLHSAAINASTLDNSTRPNDYDVFYCPVFNVAGTAAAAGSSLDNDTASTVADSIEDDYNLLFEFVTYGVLLNVIGVFGILGNVISMIILSRPQMKSSINYLLIGLARCDTVLIITSMLLFGLPIVYPTTGWLFSYYFKVYPLIAPVVYPIAMISQTVSVYLTLTVTLERFVAVCHPLRARSLCTYGRARAYVVATIVFSVLYNVTRFWEVTVQKCMHTGYSQYVYQVSPSELRNDKQYISIYIHWMYLVIMYFIPFGSLAVLNAAIYNQVRLANRERQRLSRLQKKEIGLATMLLCVVVVFLLCNVWALITNVAEAFYGITVDRLVKVSNLLVTINSSVNFVIYVIFGEKFKRLFFKLFFPQGVWMCGWHHPADGRGGAGGEARSGFCGGGGVFGGDGNNHHHAANDESEVTCNGATTFECRQLTVGTSLSPPPSSSADKFKRFHRNRQNHNAHNRHHYHHHHHHHHNHHHHNHHNEHHQEHGIGTSSLDNNLEFPNNVDGVQCGVDDENGVVCVENDIGFRCVSNAYEAKDHGCFTSDALTTNSGIVWDNSTTSTCVETANAHCT